MSEAAKIASGLAAKLAPSRAPDQDVRTEAPRNGGVGARLG